LKAGVRIPMRAYFVRMTANKQVVGLFVASSVSSLAANVDECCDPESCEYAVAKTGGIMLDAPTAATWPLSDPPNGDGRGYRFATGLEGGSLSQRWEDDLRYNRDALDWKPLRSAFRRALAGGSSAPD
jgi:hypothetical protein